MSNQRPDIGNEVPNDVRTALVKFLSSWKFQTALFTILGSLFVFFAYRSYNKLHDLGESVASLKGMPEDVRLAKKGAEEAKVEAAKLSGIPARVEGLASSLQSAREQLAAIKTKTDSLENLSAKASDISSKVAATAKVIDEQDKRSKAIEESIGKLAADLKGVSEKVADLKSTSPPKKLQLQLRLPEKESGEDDGYAQFNCALPKLGYAGAGIIEKIELRSAKSETSLPEFVARAELSPDRDQLRVFVKTGRLEEFRAAVSKSGVEVTAIVSFQ